MKEKQNRSQRVQMLISKREKDLIAERAEGMGLSISSYLRRLALQDIKAQRKEMNK